jgi:hypothetical protein
VTAGFKSGGQGGEDVESGVGVHSPYALISLGEGVSGEVHAGFYTQTTAVMELLLVIQAEEGGGMGPGVVKAAVGRIMMMVGLGAVLDHLLGGQMRDPGQGKIGIPPLRGKRRIQKKRFWKIEEGVNLRNLQQVPMVMTRVLN